MGGVRGDFNAIGGDGDGADDNDDFDNNVQQ
jgi:hypothetical protein